MIPSHKFAGWLLDAIDRLLALAGLERYHSVEQAAYLLIVVCVALLVGISIRRIVLWLLRRYVRFRHTGWGELMLRDRTMQKCSHIVTPLVLMAFVPFMFESSSTLHTVAIRCVGSYLLIAVGVVVSAVLHFVWMLYDTRDNVRHLPLKGLLNVAVGMVWIIVAILTVSVCINRSPVALLGGLGACAAVLMLVFKDSILGFVAGLQLSLNDMLHVGDWITVPSTPADGVVEDVTVTVVKVRNFDNTLIMLPPYTLVSSSFQNWKGMTDSGMRRIARDILIDASTVTGDTSAATSDGTDPSAINLGRFRAYCLDYLHRHPRITSRGLVMVRLMPQTESGIPMQIYCFTDTTDWYTYESIQSQIFEHLTAAAPAFGLTVYNLPPSISPSPS